MKFLTLALLATASLTFGSCSVFRSDVNSPNPLIAEQARRVNELEGQYNQQKLVVDNEKTKLKSVSYQLKSARQELKARKQQAKSSY